MDSSGLRRRCPALLAALSLAIGIVCSDTLRLPVELWLTAAGAAWTGGFLTYRCRIRSAVISWCVWGTLLSLGGLRHHQYTRLLPAEHIRRAEVYGLKGELTACLLEDPVTLADGRRRVRVRSESLQPPDSPLIRLEGDILLTISADVTHFAADAGDRIRILCRVIRPQPARNPGEFDYRRFLATRHDLHATAGIYRDTDVVELESRPDVWWRQNLIRPMRRSLHASLTAHLSGAPAGLLVGMLLGEKHEIPTNVATQFRMTGLAHALVISGLHVGLVAVFLLTLLRVVRVPDSIACWVTVALLVLYALITQMQAPVVRASLMAAIVLIGGALELRGSVLNSLGLAALCLMIADPTCLLTLSFQLSFAATLAIVTLHGPLMSLWPTIWSAQTSLIGKWILMPATVSVAAQVGTLPLIVYHFQQLAPISLLANLLVVPLLGIAVAQGLLLVLITPVLPALGTVVSASIWLTLTGLMRVVDLFALLPPWRVAQPQPWVAIVWMFVTGLTILAIYQVPVRRLVVLSLLFVANASVWQRVLEPSALEVTFLDVGQGDGAVVRFPDGKTMIVDAGMRSRRIDMGNRVLVPWLRRQGIDEVDVVVASHPHADHIGGLVSLLEQVKVRHFVDGGQTYDSWTSGRLRQLIAERTIAYHAVRAGDSLAGLGGAGALVLHPTSNFVDDAGHSLMGLNNGSVVFRLDYASRRLLFTGDIEHETDAAMIAWDRELRVDVLKVAHHGSATSSGRGFLNAVKPHVAVISVGAHNKFRHPADVVIRRLHTMAQVRRTDHDGAVTVRIDGDGSLRVGRQLTDDP